MHPRRFQFIRNRKVPVLQRNNFQDTELYGQELKWPQWKVFTICTLSWSHDFPPYRDLSKQKRILMNRFRIFVIWKVLWSQTSCFKIKWYYDQHDLKVAVQILSFRIILNLRSPYLPINKMQIHRNWIKMNLYLNKKYATLVAMIWVSPHLCNHFTGEKSEIWSISYLC